MEAGLLVSVGVPGGPDVHRVARSADDPPVTVPTGTGGNDPMSHKKPDHPHEPDQYKVLCIPTDHHHIDSCWLSGWMAGHTAGYAAAREDAATRMSLREARAQVAELSANLADVKARLAADHARRDPDEKPDPLDV